MSTKITDQPEILVFQDVDFLDISVDTGGGVYVSFKVSIDSLKTLIKAQLISGSGTTYSTNKFDLGGTLTSPVNILGASIPLSIGTVGSPLSTFGVHGVSGTQEYISGAATNKETNNPSQNRVIVDNGGGGSTTENQTDSTIYKQAVNSTEDASLTFTPSSVGLVHTRPSGTSFYTSTGDAMEVGSDSGKISFANLAGSNIFTDTATIKAGLEYAADYAANYTNRSLVDKEYVDSVSVAPDAFGISDGTGVYTYYSTLALAAAASSSGDTIQQFANATFADLADKVTMPAGVNFNGNGYVMTFTNAGLYGGTAIILLTGTTCDFLNANVVYTGGGANRVFSVTVAEVNFWGTKVNSNGTFAFGDLSVSDATVRGIKVFSSGATAIYGAAANTNIEDCIGISTGKIGIQANNATSYCLRCYGGSTTNEGLYISNSDFCYGTSTAKSGALIQGDSRFLTGISTAKNGIQLSTGVARITHFYALSDTFSAVVMNDGGDQYVGYGKAISTGAVVIDTDAVAGEKIIDNCTFISEWNNAGGHGIQLDIDGAKVIGCTIITANDSASNIYAAAARSATIVDNNYITDSATPVHANITPVAVTVDADGNALIPR
jgi:hypothetical protein